MKSLILMRHAKAKTDFSGLDIDRPLTKSGKASIIQLFPKLNSFIQESPHFYASISVRTKQTMAAICQELDAVQVHLSIETSLYHASFNEIVAFIQSIDSHINQVIIIGHNPGMHEFVARCKQDFSIAFPPASFCVIQSPVINWHDFAVDKSKVNYLYHSK